MVYDCFIFNDELSLLKLRLLFLKNVVDRFVLVESERTLRGSSKSLYYQANKEMFSEFHDKIIHLICPNNDLPPWEYEFYQRNYIKKGLVNCADEDIIFISDADEIVNIRAVLNLPGLQLPALIEIPMYYYFLNVKTNASFFVNLAGRWSFIKNQDLGFRYRDYEKFTGNKVTVAMANTGWHFSYLFGYDIEKYQEKIKSFSHQEYHNPFFLNKKRISRCIHLCIDIFERPFMRLSVDNTGITSIFPYITQTNLKELMYTPTYKKYLSIKNIWFILHSKYYRRIKFGWQKIFTKNIPANNA